MVRRSPLALLTALLLALGACGGDSDGDGGTAPPTPVPTTVTVTPSSTTLSALGATTTFQAVVRDQNGDVMSNVTVTWSSSRPDVATISAAGVATAASDGTTTLTAQAGSASGTASLTVEQEVSAIEVTPATATLVGSGETVQLDAQVQDANRNSVPGVSITWSSSSSSTAQVDASGLVTSGSPGSATITAAAQGVEGTAQITVERPPVAQVVVTPASSTLVGAGETVQLEAEARDASGQEVPGASVAWTSSAPSVAQVDGQGLVTSAGPGTATITATSEGVQGTASVEVLAPVAEVDAIGTFRVKVGDSYTYTFEARLADGTVVDRPGTWSVADPSRAEMTPGGTLTPLQAGSITLRITIDGEVWTVQAEAYDWETLEGTSSRFLILDADVQVTNKFGTSEYPELVFACDLSSGDFFAWVDTEFFVTASGAVAYSFGSGDPISDQWLEFDDFSALGHPGPTNGATKAFASTMATVNRFGFAFTEFQGPSHATLFRVTGMAPGLDPLLQACPSDAVRAAPGATAFEAQSALQAAMDSSPQAVQDARAELAALRDARARSEPDSAGVAGVAPDLSVDGASAHRKAMSGEGGR